ncbi:MAG: peptidase S8 [Thermotogae bacterium]|nr:MAG: peptidase S8 [Thermotogota bacterium]
MQTILSSSQRATSEGKGVMLVRALKIILLLGLIGIFLASCAKFSLDAVDGTSGSGTTSGSVRFGELGGYEVFENRLIVGYEDRAAVDRIIEQLDAEVLIELPKLKAVSLKLPISISEAYQVLKKLKLEGVRYVEPSYKRYLVEPVKTHDEILLSPSSESSEDPYYPHQWALRTLKAEEAWEKATGEGIVVAVVDTPIDGEHPDLIGQFVTGYDPELGVEIPPDTDYEDPLNPDDDHGSHVAGIIAAKRGNGEGIVGLAYNAKIMPILIFRGYESHSGYYYVGDEYVAAGITWAVDNGADVLSNSWGGGGYSQLLKDAIDYAIENGVVFVAAAGNEHTDQHWHYPSAYPGVIAVGASTARDEIVGFSSRGDYLSVAAPGVNVLSCIPRASAEDGGVYGTPYAYWGGTSMATPYVSALVALLKELHSDATPYQIKRILEETAEDIEEPGYDRSSGYGRIDAAEAVNVDPSTYDGSVDFDVHVGEHTGTWAVPAVYVTLSRNDGPNYYAKTDDYGVAKFYGIDPDEYDVYIGGPNYLDMNAWNLRMAEELAIATAVGISGESSITVLLESSFVADLTADSTGDYTLKLVDVFTGSEAYSEDFSDSVSLSFPKTLPGGPYYLMVERSATEGSVTFEGTVTINGEEIPVSGAIADGETEAYVDEYGGAGYWWTVF